MSTPPVGNEPGLVGYWKSDAGTGNILYDHSGNANHGTINGATWSTDVPGVIESFNSDLPEDYWVFENNENDKIVNRLNHCLPVII